MNDAMHEQNPAAGANPSGAPDENARGYACGKGSCIFEPIASAFRRGGEDARRAAENAAPKVKELLLKVGSQMAYGLSYAAALQLVLFKRLCPDPFKEAWRSGFGEGTAYGEQVAARFNEPKKQAESEPAPPVLSAEPRPGMP